LDAFLFILVLFLTFNDACLRQQTSLVVLKLKGAKYICPCDVTQVTQYQNKPFFDLE